MQARTPAVKWSIRVMAMLLFAGLVARMVTLNLETADKVASVIGCLASVAALLWTAFGTTPRAATLPPVQAAEATGLHAAPSSSPQPVQPPPIRVRLWNKNDRSAGATQNIIIGPNGPVHVGDGSGKG